MSLDAVGWYVYQVLSATGLLYPAYIIVALMLAYVFYAIFHIILISSDYIGVYHKPKSLTERAIHRLKIVGVYFGLSPFVFLAVLSILQITTPTLLDYVLFFPVMLSILIAFRLLAIPTKLTYRLFYRKNPFKPLIIQNSDRKQVQNINDQTTSLFFGFIIIGFIVIVINFIFEESRNRLLSNLNGLINLSGLPIIILAYIFAVFISGMIIEWFLESTEIIPTKNEDDEYLTFEI